MNIIIGILLGILVLASILLVLIILVQDDGSNGAGIIFGSAASQQYGAKKGNVVTRTTGVLATLFILVTLTLSFLFQYNSEDVDIFDENTEDAVYEWWDTSDATSDEVPLDSPAASIKDIESSAGENETPVSEAENTSASDVSSDSESGGEKATPAQTDETKTQ